MCLELVYIPTVQICTCLCSLQVSAQCARPRAGCHPWRGGIWWIFCAIVVLSCLNGVVQAQLSSEAVTVATPEEFQDAVRLGRSHIVITEHLNMVESPRFSNGTHMDTAMISIVKTDVSVTKTIRVHSLSIQMCIVSAYPDSVA